MPSNLMTALSSGGELEASSSMSLATKFNALWLIVAEEWCIPPVRRKDGQSRTRI